MAGQQTLPELLKQRLGLVAGLDATAAYVAIRNALAETHTVTDDHDRVLRFYQSLYRQT